MKTIGFVAASAELNKLGVLAAGAVVFYFLEQKPGEERLRNPPEQSEC